MDMEYTPAEYTPEETEQLIEKYMKEAAERGVTEEDIHMAIIEGMAQADKDIQEAERMEQEAKKAEQAAADNKVIDFGEASDGMMTDEQFDEFIKNADKASTADLIRQVLAIGKRKDSRSMDRLFAIFDFLIKRDGTLPACASLLRSYGVTVKDFNAVYASYKVLEAFMR